MLISNIPTLTFNQIISDLRADGWEKTVEYDGMDAWIDYGMIKLQKQSLRLKFEWDNWFEGTVQDPDILLQELKQRYTLL